MQPGAVCDVGITTRSRDRPWWSRAWNVAEELALSVTFFRVALPVAVTRWRSTNLSTNAERREAPAVPL